MIKIRFVFCNLFRSMNFDLKVGSFDQQKMYLEIKFSLKVSFSTKKGLGQKI